MSLFEFKLKPLPEVLPWEHEGKKYLHWFGLTDGIYYLNIKGNELYKNSKEYLNYLKKNYPESNIDTPYIDYQIVRLYEDFLEILPNVLHEIPDNLITLIKFPDSEKDFLNKYDFKEDEEADWDTYYNATRWWGCRSLSSMHLQHSPIVQFWVENEMVHIRWNNSDQIENGIQIWESLKGEEEYSKDEFLNEVNNFHNRLMDEMEDRINEIEKDNPIPNIDIDLKQLKNEQIERRESLQIALKTEPDIKDWNEVIDAIATITKKKSPR
ncbi:MAG: hypothetical protein JXB17_07320 [Bacteroidales bacterium]|nr:hypothetical protein [Bacteroidales bacterium]